MDNDEFAMRTVLDLKIQFFATVLAAIGLPLAILVWMRHYYYHRRRHTEEEQNINMPRCLNRGWMETTRKMTSPEAIWFFREWAEEMGCVFRVRIPHPQWVFVVGDPKLARDILNDPTTIKPHAFYATADQAVGATNIFTANGERWKHARRATAPSFASAHIKRMNQVCKEKLEQWIRCRLDVFCQTGQAFDAGDEMILLTLSIISEAAFEYDMKEEEASFFAQELDLAVREFILRRGSNPLRGTWLTYLLDSSVIRRANLASRNIRSIAEKILLSYRSKNNGSLASSKGTVIENIVMNQHYENDKQRIADLLVFLVGGHDTTAYTIAWTLLELARNPHEMERVRTELSSLATEEERLKCPALDHLIKESMRLHPVAASYLREVSRDFHLDDTTIIPKGSVVFLVNMLIHRHPQYFDHPDQFMPSRWESKGASNALAFTPFSLGARSCVGQALADAELHTVVARLVMDYDFEVVDPGKAECTLTLKPCGLKIKAKKQAM